MCSILGCHTSGLNRDDVEKLNKTLGHRGPDHHAVMEYRLGDRALFLAHNRLAIQDLDPKANQPMENERFALIFNGEIYNHLEIREALAPREYRTHSDTETILWAFTEYGVEKALSMFVGMFAIGLFDKTEEKLYLIRDRVGIKPLYYALDNGELAFASELKGIPDAFKHSRSNRSLVTFMTLGYIPGEHTAYDRVSRVKPGHLLVYDGRDIVVKPYWELPGTKREITYHDALDETERLVRSAVKYRLLSDLEVGCFLSGGVDSSLVASVMQEQAGSQIKTFSIGFGEQGYDESGYAEAVAGDIGSEHFSFRFGPEDVLALMDTYGQAFDEPFGDVSALPMLLLSRATKSKVTVALSGDGGDELFLGYDRYFFTEKYHRRLSKIPGSVRSGLAALLSVSGVDRLEKMSYPLRKLATENLYAVIASSVKPWEQRKVFNRDFLQETFKKEQVGLFELLEAGESGNGSIEMLSRTDFYRYLPDDILTKVDRTSMQYALEARVPLLDHRLVEFAYSLPTELKLANGPKSILKDVLARHIPRELIDRPKRGFSVPLKIWFRNELRSKLYETIEGLDGAVFNKRELLKMADLHVKHGRNYEYIFWNLMQL